MHWSYSGLIYRACTSVTKVRILLGAPVYVGWDKHLSRRREALGHNHNVRLLALLVQWDDFGFVNRKRWFDSNTMLQFCIVSSTAECALGKGEAMVQFHHDAPVSRC